ncbi:thioredoxin family protein [Oleiharenicola lentus]|uniref:thioredoxin family protein n=1 Tax=Oleiharenicola lentus TaxID=2508720 RepID=UPI003F660DFD
MKRLLLLASILAAATLSAFAEPEYPKQGPDIYDPKVDGFALIADAQVKAKSENKNVLLMFGANWCVWCHRLHHTFETDAAVKTLLSDNYELVLIDVNTRKGEKRNAAVDEKYGNPIKQGLPVLVVLDAEGQQLTTQETGALEDGKAAHDSAKVSAFLKQWSPKR